MSNINELGILLIEQIKTKNETQILKTINDINTQEYHTIQLVYQIHDKDGNTALTLACKNNMSKVAKEIIKTYGNGNPIEKDAYGNTALLWACKNSMSDVALELLETEGKGFSTESNGNNETSLMWACRNNMEDVALQILKTTRNNGMPELIDIKKNTALIWACKNNMTNVALEILKTPEHGNPKIIDETKRSALNYAYNNKMTTVFSKILNILYKLLPLRFIDYNINQSQIGFNNITGEEGRVSLKNSGIVFIYDNYYYLVNGNDLRHILFENKQNKYPCIYDSRELQNTQFIDLKLITGFSGWIPYSNLLQVYINFTKYNNKYYLLQKTGKICKDNKNNDFIYNIVGIHSPKINKSIRNYKSASSIKTPNSTKLASASASSIKTPNSTKLASASPTVNPNWIHPTYTVGKHTRKNGLESASSLKPSSKSSSMEENKNIYKIKIIDPENIITNPRINKEKVIKIFMPEEASYEDLVMRSLNMNYINDYNITILLPGQAIKNDGKSSTFFRPLVYLPGNPVHQIIIKNK